MRLRSKFLLVLSSLLAPVGATASDDGLSKETAIIIDEKAYASEGVSSEYRWLKEHYPGWEVVVQKYVGSKKDGREFDMLEIQSRDGEQKNIYFDVTVPLAKRKEYFDKRSQEMRSKEPS